MNKLAAPTYDLGDRLLTFSSEVVRLVQTLSPDLPGKRIGDQLLRCATSAGANFEECRGSYTRADFCNRLQIALKEMRETYYWLKLVAESGLDADHDRLTKLIEEARQLRAILGKSTITARRTNLKQQTANLKP